MCDIRNLPVIEAIQRAAQDHGLKALAPLLDKKPSTLYAELNPWAEPGKAKLGFDDALEIMRITGDFSGLDLAAATLGFRLCLMEANPDKNTVAEELADVMQELGTLARVCMQPDATEAAVHLVAAALHGEIDEAEKIKISKLRERKI